MRLSSLFALAGAFGDVGKQEPSKANGSPASGTAAVLDHVQYCGNGLERLRERRLPKGARQVLEHMLTAGDTL